MSKYLYRFRSLERLLEKDELLNQEVYFAPPDELNDPIEGHYNIYWQGDSILWTNLFKHYLLCLQRVHLIAQFGGKDFKLSDDDIQIFLSSEKLETNMYRERIDKLNLEFFAEESVKLILESLSQSDRKIKREELLFYFRTIHTLAIAKVLSSNHFTPDEIKEQGKNVTTATVESLRKFVNVVEHNNHETVALQFQIAKSFSMQNNLIHAYNDPRYKDNENKRFLIFDFPEKYLKGLEQLMYPTWYAACFMENVENSAMWSYYGERHTGVCLKFKTQNIDSNLFLNLEGVASHSYRRGDPKTYKNIGEIRFPFYKVCYEPDHKDFNFFLSLGQLPLNDIYQNWFIDQAGNKSKYLSSMSHGDEVWRKEHWKRFHESTSAKLKDWLHETEYRLVFSSSLNRRIEKEERLLKYNISDLDGIVFGIRTPLDKKIEIMKIIEKKCKETEYQDFKFYQAIYSQDKGKIEIEELPLLRISTK